MKKTVKIKTKADAAEEVMLKISHAYRDYMEKAVLSADWMRDDCELIVDDGVVLETAYNNILDLYALCPEVFLEEYGYMAGLKNGEIVSILIAEELITEAEDEDEDDET